MSEAENKAKLFMKIVRVMEEVGQIQKDREIRDKSGKLMYMYLSEEATTGALQTSCAKQKLVMLPVKTESELIYKKVIQYDKATEVPITKLTVTYLLGDAETGATQEIQSIGYGTDGQDKDSNKAMTGAFKYAQRQTFMISTGDDPDHNGEPDTVSIPIQEAKPAQAPGKSEPPPNGNAAAPDAAQGAPASAAEPPKGNTYGPIPQSLRIKYKTFKGSQNGMDEWLAAQREKGNDYAMMEKILAEGIKKKNAPQAS